MKLFLKFFKFSKYYKQYFYLIIFFDRIKRYWKKSLKVLNIVIELFKIIKKKIKDNKLIILSFIFITYSLWQCFNASYEIEIGKFVGLNIFVFIFNSLCMFVWLILLIQQIASRILLNILNQMKVTVVNNNINMSKN